MFGLLSRSVLAQPPAGTEPLQRAFFEIVINGSNLGDTLVLLGRDDVWVPVDVLERAGLRSAIGARRDVGGRAFISLKSLAPDLTYELDEAALVIKIAASSGLFGVNVITVQTGRPPDVEYGGKPTLFVNYGANYRPSSSSDATAEIGASLGRTFVSTTASAVSKGHVVRGVSQLVVDGRVRMRRLTVGDRFVSTGVLGGSALVGGVTVSKDFGLDPYFVRYPTLDFSGAVTTPSVVEVYVNDRLVNRAEIAPGPFELRRVPIPNGSGDTRVVVHDAFGRTREVSSPFYLTTALLSPGVHDYSYSMGWTRRGSGIDNWNYGRPVWLASHRVGLTRSLTVGVRGEARQGLWNAGPLFTATLWRLGEAEFAAAGSRDRNVVGYGASAGYRYQGQVISGGFAARYKSPQYATVSSSPQDSKARFETTSFVGLMLGALLSITAQHATTENYPGVFSERQRVRTAVAISSRLTRRLSLFVTGGQTRANGVRSRDAVISLGVVLGSRRIASVSVERGPIGRKAIMEVQQSAPIGEGVGYRFHGERGRPSQGGGKVTYNSPYGRYEADYERIESEQAGSISAAGALVAIDRHLFVTRPVEDGFAVIKVPDVKGVRAFSSNQEVGRTGRGGYLLVPNLLPYYGNILSIADQDVPFDYALDRTRRVVAPPYRGGTLVTFSARRHRAVTGLVSIDARGTTIVPAYGQLTIIVDRETVESPIGQRGEFYLEGLPAGTYPARVVYRGETCELTLRVPSSTDAVIYVGSVRCLVR